MNFPLKKSLALLLIALGAGSAAQAAGVTYQFRVAAKGTVGGVKSLQLSPASLQFAATDPHQSSTQSITVLNTGTTNVSVLSIAMASGTSDFNQANNCSAPLAAGASCTLTVMATPSSPGAKSGSLNVVSDAVGSPQLVSLSAGGNYLADSLGSFTVATKTIGTGNFQLAAPSSASTGLFTYSSSNLAVATVAGSTITMLAPGTTQITASQAASGDYSSGSVTATFTVAAIVPTLGSFSVPNKTVGDGALAISAPSSNSGGAFTFTSSSPSIASISGTTLTVGSAGTTTITATQAAAGNYASTSKSVSMTVSAPNPVGVTFGTCGQSGSSGPTATQCSSAYASTSLAGAVSVTNGYQYWTVPTTGLYTITVQGAQGGTDSSGNQYGPGATLTASLPLTAGNQLQILVGQPGLRQVGASSRVGVSGGGGGTYVAQGGALLIAAGGGGGYGASNPGTVGRPGIATQTGTGGGGVGSPGGYGGAGAGFTGNGGADTSFAGSVALSFLNGGSGGGLSGTNGCTPGLAPAAGGFGGGGGGGCDGGGGGGGYTGGASAGFGGSSFYTGTLISSSASASGAGKVTITKP